MAAAVGRRAFLEAKLADINQELAELGLTEADRAQVREYNWAVEQAEQAYQAAMAPVGLTRPSRGSAVAVSTWQEAHQRANSNRNAKRRQARETHRRGYELLSRYQSWEQLRNQGTALQEELAALPGPSNAAAGAAPAHIHNAEAEAPEEIDNATPLQHTGPPAMPGTGSPAIARAAPARDVGVAPSAVSVPPTAVVRALDRLENAGLSDAARKVRRLASLELARREIREPVSADEAAEVWRTVLERQLAALQDEEDSEQHQPQRQQRQQQQLPQDRRPAVATLQNDQRHPAIGSARWSAGLNLQGLPGSSRLQAFGAASAGLGGLGGLGLTLGGSGGDLNSNSSVLGLGHLPLGSAPPSALGPLAATVQREGAWADVFDRIPGLSSLVSLADVSFASRDQATFTHKADSPLPAASRVPAGSGQTLRILFGGALAALGQGRAGVGGGFSYTRGPPAGAECSPCPALQGRHGRIQQGLSPHTAVPSRPVAIYGQPAPAPLREVRLSRRSRGGLPAAPASSTPAGPSTAPCPTRQRLLLLQEARTQLPRLPRVAVAGTWGPNGSTRRMRQAGAGSPPAGLGRGSVSWGRGRPGANGAPPPSSRRQYSRRWGS
ncbi:hypothetical protein Agub_g4194 [Astrephomene gubernaculifera]|uniref:Uncharacterized protein n=2 Tax=Astrephomene gubernaculifera TaxID=47775 RepID=A0AAD3DJW1_9CHLO|nr:hypothetical protein Agub_g4194 [Astrephomene gubernaculifera]